MFELNMYTAVSGSLNGKDAVLFKIEENPKGKYSTREQVLLSFEDDTKRAMVEVPNHWVLPYAKRFLAENGRVV